MKSKIINYHGKEIIFADYRNFTELNDLVQENEAVDNLVCSRPLGSVLIITDVTGTIGSTPLTNQIKKSSARTKPYIAKNALIGVTGFKRALAELLSFQTGIVVAYFDNVEEAMEWLVKK